MNSILHALPISRNVRILLAGMSFEILVAVNSHFLSLSYCGWSVYGNHSKHNNSLVRSDQSY